MNWNRSFFQGRYGFDQFSFFLLLIAILLWPIRYLFVISLLLAAYVLFRALSTDRSKRQRELWVFNGAMMRCAAFFRRHFAFLPRFFRWAGGKFALAGLRWKQRKTSVFLRCPKCHGTLRLPRGKGMLMVRCPVCGHEFKKKT